MSDAKISALPSSTTPLAGTEVLPIVQSGATKKTSVESVLTSVQPSGTANGVVYLNGSKVATSGSSLKFDGAKLDIANSPATNSTAIVVSGTTTSFNRIRMTNTSADARFGIEGSTNAQAASGSLAYSTLIGSHANYPLQFVSNGAVRATLDTSGNFGIGTSAPASSAGYTSLTLNNTTSGYLVLQTNGVTTSDWYVSGGAAATIRGVEKPLSLQATGANYITASTNSIERVRIESSGDVKINTGNLVIGTSGKGIDFSADGQAAGMTSELLDDYEEGTWTATLTPLTSGTITLSAATCTYTKVGRLVTVNGQINTSAISSPLGRLRLATLPFVVASGTSFESVATIRVAGAVSVIAIDAVIANSGNFIDIYPAGTSTDTYASNIDASTSIVFSAKYFV